MPTYKPCHEESIEVDTMLSALIHSGPDHIDLEEKKVTINALFAYPRLDKYGRPVEEAIKVNQYKALACIKITSYKDRVKGMRDAELLVDYPWWEKASNEEKRAVLDHELTHLIVQKDDYERVILDKAGRPKLKMRLHDIQVGWFASIANRYGRASVEVKQAAYLFDKRGQAYWPELHEATEIVRKGIYPELYPAEGASVDEAPGVTTVPTT